MGDYYAMLSEFARRGRIARDAYLDVTDAFRAGLRSRDGASYSQRLDEDRAARKAALPPGGDQFLRNLDAGSPRAVDIATAFLQADGFFPESGYAKAAIIRRLKRAPLTRLQKARLQSIVLERVEGPDRNEFASNCRLALAVRSPELEAEVERRTQSDDPGIRRRARWMMLRFASVPVHEFDA